MKTIHQQAFTFINRLGLLIVLLTVCGLTMGMMSAKPDSMTGADAVINAPFANPDFQYWVEIFERPDREIYAKRHKIIQHLSLQPGMRVADIGAGTGFMSFLMAEKVGTQGEVFAVDISQPFVDKINFLAKEKNLPQLKALTNSQETTGLNDNAIDLAFICDTYHHFEAPMPLLRDLYRALSPTGEVVIIDYRRHPTESSPWVLDHVRAGRDVVIKEMQAAGFELKESLDFLTTNYYLRFKKKELAQ